MARIKKVHQAGASNNPVARKESQRVKKKKPKSLAPKWRHLHEKTKKYWNYRQRQGRRWLNNEIRNNGRCCIDGADAHDEASATDILVTIFKQPAEFEGGVYRHRVLPKHPAALIAHDRYLEERGIAIQGQSLREHTLRVKDWRTDADAILNKRIADTTETPLADTESRGLDHGLEPVLKGLSLHSDPDEDEDDHDGSSDRMDEA